MIAINKDVNRLDSYTTLSRDNAFVDINFVTQHYQEHTSIIKLSPEVKVES